MRMPMGRTAIVATMTRLRRYSRSSFRYTARTRFAFTLMSGLPPRTTTRSPRSVESYRPGTAGRPGEPSRDRPRNADHSLVNDVSTLYRSARHATAVRFACLFGGPALLVAYALAPIGSAGM